MTVSGYKGLFAACVVVCIGALLLSPRLAHAEPVWELGAGVAALSLPDYRGSKQSHSYLLPFPYAVYRGERMSLDRQGLRARLFDLDRLHIEGSFIGNFALRSSDNTLRTGMSPLYPLLEAGPELVYTLIAAQRSSDLKLDLRLATRAAFAVGGGRLSSEGLVASPYFRLSMLDPFGAGFRVTATAGLLFADSRYNDYLYSVAPEFATASRPAYRAAGGYSGTIALLAAGRNYGRLWIGGYLRVDSLRGASFTSSPLVETRSSTALGIAMAWVFAQSAEQALRTDE